MRVPKRFSAILDDWMKANGMSLPSNTTENKLLKPALTPREWSESIREVISGHPGKALGLQIGKCIQLHHTGPLGYQVVNNHTFRELLETYTLFEKWFYGENLVTQKIEGDRVHLIWDDRHGKPDRYFEQVNSMALVTIIHQFCPAVGHPIEVHVMNEEAGESQMYQKAFHCPVSFSQRALRISYSAACLNEPVDVRSTSLHTAWQTRVRTLGDKNTIGFVHSVQKAILENLITGASSKSVASSLNLSLRTMQRRLHEVGCNYQQLLNGIRERHSRNLLKEGRLNLKEIAFLLGYANQSAFNHAYHRWNGHSPRKGQKPYASG